MAGRASLSNATRTLVESAGVCETSVYHEKLAQRIAELREEIRILENCHNQVTPICCLPPEILSKIFLTLSAVTPRHHPRDSVSWFRVSHVCVHWRSVALSCSDLWANLRFVSPAFTELMLDRAREALLSVVFLPKTNPERFYDVIKRALSRPGSLRTLKLRTWGNFGTSLNPFDSIGSIWNQAPFLRTLTLLGHPHDPQTLFETPQHHIGDVPGLQDLHLKFVRLRWKCIPFSQLLRFLRLDQSSGDSASDGYHRPSVEEFTSSFKEMPRLESLYLGEYAPRLAPQPETPIQTRILFPALHQIEIIDSSLHLSQFFRLVEIPGSAHTSARISDSSPAMPAIAEVLRGVKEVLRLGGRVHTNPSGLRMERLGLECRLCFYYDEGDLRSDDDLTMPPLSIVYEELSGTTHDILPLLDSQFGLSTISLLHVALGIEASRDWLRLQRLPVKTLTIASSSFAVFLDILGQESFLNGGAIADRENPSGVPFFALSTLICQNISFIHFFGDSSRLLVEYLAQVLQKRAKLGYALAELHISLCSHFGPGEARIINQSLPDLKLVWV